MGQKGPSQATRWNRCARPPSTHPSLPTLLRPATTLSRGVDRGGIDRVPIDCGRWQRRTDPLVSPPKPTGESSETDKLPRTRKYIRCATHHRLIHRPRRGPHRLIHLPRPEPHRLIHPPRRGPHRLIQIPALASGADASQAPPNPTAAIAAPDHFPKLRRNRRRSSESCSFSEPPISEDGRSSIAIGGEVLTPLLLEFRSLESKNARRR